MMPAARQPVWPFVGYACVRLLFIVYLALRLVTAIGTYAAAQRYAIVGLTEHGVVVFDRATGQTVVRPYSPERG
jgi:hypothetical protein